MLIETFWETNVRRQTPAVPRKCSADCDTIYTIFLSLSSQTADPNPFRGTHCSGRMAEVVECQRVGSLPRLIFFFL